MAVCEDCKKEVVRDYQTVETKRHTKLYFCNECMSRYKRKEVNNADNSSELIRQH